jgi:1-acyl-sn-glycerol-3-phosphate acyltransferase
MMKVIADLRAFLGRGGKLFVFPEGTRMPAGTTGKFHKGAFSLARRCRAPLELLRVVDTDRLMRPGNLWYSTCVDTRVRVERLATLHPDYDAPDFSLKALIDRVRGYYDAPTQGADGDQKEVQ